MLSKRNSRRYLWTVAILASAASSVRAGDILDFDVHNEPGGTNNFGLSTPPSLSVTNDASIAPIVLARGSGVGTIGTGAARGFGGNAWSDTANDDDSGSAAAGIANNQFITFGFTVNAGDSDTLSDLVLNYRHSGTGPTMGQLDYQIDTTTSTGSFTTLASALAFPVNTSGGATLSPNVDLTSIPMLTAGETILFRLTPYGGTGTAGTWYVFDVANSSAPDLQIQGTSSVNGPVAPAVLTWNGGSTTWDESTQNWINVGPASDTIWNNTFNGPATIASFQTGDTVNIAAGGITTFGLNFSAGSFGIIIQGPGKLTLDSPNITIDPSVNATISAQIAGAVGLGISGGGNLTLASTLNSFTGGVVVSGGDLFIDDDRELGGLSNNVTLIGGTMVFTANVTSLRTFVLNSDSRLDTQNDVVSIANLGGTGNGGKEGTGTLIITGASSTRSGTNFVDEGTLVVTATDSNGVSGLGTGGVTIESGATFRIDASNTPGGVYLGFKPDTNIGGDAHTATLGTSQTITFNDQTTLEAIGDTRAAGTIEFPSSGQITISVPNPGDSFIAGTALRNTTTGTSSAVINVIGGGVFQLASGGISVSTTGTQYSGTWLVNMSSSGVMEVGPSLAGLKGEPLNALGYSPPITSNSTNGWYTGATNALTLMSGTVAFGADQADFVASGTNSTATSIRSPLTLSGGAIASTGFEYNTDPNFSNASSGVHFTSTTVAANLSACITLTDNAAVTVDLFDPDPSRGPATTGGRSLNIMTDPGAIDPDSGNPLPDDFTWGNGSTLIVDATGVSSNFGQLTFSRTSGTVTIGVNDLLQINPNAQVTIAGAQNILGDGTSNVVNVTDNGLLTFNRADVMTVGGNITGSGNLALTGAGTLLLTADNAVANTTIAPGATLQIGNGSTSGTLSTGNLTNNGNLVLNRSDISTVTISGALAGNGALSHIGSGTTTLAVTNYQATGPINVAAGRLVLPGGPIAVVASNLTIAGTPTAPTATLDIKDGGLVIPYTDSGVGATLTSTLYAQAVAARGVQDPFTGLSPYNQPGLTSSTAAFNNANINGFDQYGVGVINNADIDSIGIENAYTSFMGQPVGVDTVLIRYTYMGDVDLDGKIDANDVSYLINSFNGFLPGYSGLIAADFDDNGIIDANDVGVLVAGFNFQGSPLDAGGLTPLGSPALDLDAGPNATPEPASLMLLGLGAVGLLRKRRRRKV